MSSNLPDDFFDSNKKSKKEQENDLAKELEEFEKEMAALQAESEEQLKEEFDKIQEDRNAEELDQRIKQWERLVDLEKKAEELKNRPISEMPTKKFKNDSSVTSEGQSQSKSTSTADEEDGINLDDIEDFEDKLFNWRSKAI